MQRVVRFRMMHSSPANSPIFPFLCSFLDGLVSTPLTTLDLTYNRIGVEGAKAIAGALPR